MAGYQSKKIYFSCLVLLCKIAVIFGDITIYDTTKSTIIAIQTASDFVRTGCGTFLKDSFIIVSQPLHACVVPIAPPHTFPLSSIYNSVKNSIYNLNEDNHHWSLLVSESGNCDIKTKFRNAASAGYSSIILGTTAPYKEFVSLKEDFEEFIDVHLINEHDLRWLPNFSYPKPFVVKAPSQETKCKEEYKKTWLRSSYLSPFIIFLRNIIYVLSTGWDFILSFFNWIIRMPWNLLEAFIPLYVTDRKTIELIKIWMGLIILFVILPVSFVTYGNYKISNRSDHSYRRANQDEHRYRRPYQEYQSYSRAYQEYQSHSRAYQEYQSYSRAYQEDQSNYSDYDHNDNSQASNTNEEELLTPRNTLGIRENELLTKAKVEKAFKLLALKKHPDKNRHLTGEPYKQMEEEFKYIVKARKALLKSFAADDKS